MIAGVVASQITLILDMSPDSWASISANNPDTSSNSTITAGGTLYFDFNAEEGDEIEIEYSINDGTFTLLYLTGYGFIGSQTLSVSHGDTIKFRATKYGYIGYVGWTIYNTNTSGDTLFTGYVECV